MVLECRRARRARSCAALLLGLFMALNVTACDGPTDEGKAVELRVMTRNLYLGADIFKVTEAQNTAEIVARVTEAWQTVQATDFPERAKRLAAEIQAADPHVVGLQEVSLYRLQSPGDLPGFVPAQDTAQDFLALLMGELDALGLSYDVVVQSTNADVEMPMLDAQGGQDDIRMTDRDVVLVRSDLSWANPATAQYTDRYVVVVGGALPVPFFRSWTAADVTVEGRTFHFVNTHLETQVDPAAQEAQGLQLISLLEDETLPTVLVGDFNSRADGTGTATYGRFTQAGWEDAWSLGGSGDGFTCCNADDLMNTTVDLDERIDLVFLSPGDFDVMGVDVVGNALADRTPDGLWPSDHAGVVATLRLN